MAVSSGIDGAVVKGAAAAMRPLEAKRSKDTICYESSRHLKDLLTSSTPKEQIRFGFIDVRQVGFVQTGNTDTEFVGRGKFGVVIPQMLWQSGFRQLNREFKMRFKKASMVAMLAVSMASTPVLAQSASSLSVTAAQPDRAGADVTDANAVNGGWFIPLLAILAVVGGILAITSGGDDAPTSP